MDNQLSRQRFRGPMARRRFLQGAGLGLTGAGASLLFGCGSDDDGAPASAEPGRPEPPPEVTTIRLPRDYTTCLAPLWVARSFLRDEGFTQVDYLAADSRESVLNELIADGRVDFAMNFSAAITFDVDRGLPLVALAGIHAACFEIRAVESVVSVVDLQGKRMAILDRAPKPTDFAFSTSVLQHIGFTPGRDVELTAIGPTLGDANRELSAGRIQAVFLRPPISQQLRDGGVGHVILDSMTDRPWAQYFCCFAMTNRTFLEKYPVATKRALRALLRAADLCSREPDAVAKDLYENGRSGLEIYAAETMRMLPYGAWRTHSVEDTMRFYALRLREAGVIKSTPDEIIKKGLDLRYLDELREKIAFAPGLGGGKFALNCDTPALFAPTEGTPS